MVQPVLPSRIEQPAAQPGADHIDIAEDDRRPGFEAGERRGFWRQAACDLGAFDDVRQQPLGIGGAERIENIRRIAARAILAEGEVGLRRIGARGRPSA